MGTRLNNIGQLFRQSRTRVILISTIIIVIFALGIGLFVLQWQSYKDNAEISVGRAPALESVPGGLNPTTEYARLQREENWQKAELAKKTGGTAIPTLIRTERIQNNARSGMDPEKVGESFSILSQQQKSQGVTKEIWFDELRRAYCEQPALDKALAQGSGLDVLKEAGCTAKQLKAAGFDLNNLNQVGYSIQQLLDAGFSPQALRSIGASIAAMREAGASACDLKNAGYSPSDLKKAGFTEGELIGAGFSPEQANALGGMAGLLPSQLLQAGCSSEALSKLRQRGVSASALKTHTDCSIEALRAAGYTTKEMGDAGYTAKELLNAGYTPSDLKKAGFSAQALKTAGVSDLALQQAGFTPAEIALAKKALILPRSQQEAIDALNRGGCTLSSLKKARAAGISALKIRTVLGCSLNALREAGYTAKEARDAGFSPHQIKTAGYSPYESKLAGLTAKDMLEAGYSPKEVLAAGFLPAQLKKSGLTAGQLKEAGLDPKALLDLGFSPKDLKDAQINLAEQKISGIPAKLLRQAGYTAEQLKKAGFSPEQLKEAGFTDTALKEAGVQPVGGPRQPIVLLNSQQAQMSAQPGETDIQRLMRQQTKQVDNQQLRQAAQQRRVSIEGYANALVKQWDVSSQQKVEVGTPVMDKKIDGSFQREDGSKFEVSKRASNQEKDVEKESPILVRAGDIFFAALDVGINSDEPSPVLATILQGKFKGARLIGQARLPPNAEKVLLQFSLMSLKNAPKTVTVNAIAIDPETARMALASEVDHHYLLRYGSLFAASLMEGYGKAVETAGTTISVSPTQTTISQGQNRTNQDFFLIGLGRVGQAFGQTAKNNMNTPPTVQVNPGTPIGVMFLQDLAEVPGYKPSLRDTLINQGMTSYEEE